jgi:hypothetical protein
MSPRISSGHWNRFMDRIEFGHAHVQRFELTGAEDMKGEVMVVKVGDLNRNGKYDSPSSGKPKTN